ncbi:MAG: aldolase catalytic domain-containing protein [Lachnospiraceae bacterium]|nr:aldolase catalytic domain-containing protein [Lachnospiraceae bacterium]MBQ5870489.1 aldolase catalytic domain-containing protein [Lachnospiraceae bacterium]
MGKVYLLDCTLRDGGYVNDWRFGAKAIKEIGRKLAQTGIEIFEVGFIKGDTYDPDRAVYPDVAHITPMIQPKDTKMKYVGMVDMSAPIPLDRIPPCDGTSIDGIRVIFKKSKIHEAYEYCKKIQELGYFISVNFVGTDLYTDKEFIEGIELFNQLKPFAVSIVDSFGLIKRKQFLRMVYLADNNLADGIALAYHAHNNLQQAFGNAEALVEMNLKRDLIIDACVFGMGRGAGNLNLELFAEYMNENYDTNYKIEPMLEIMDEYLNEIHKSKFWGYSLPLYLSAINGCHPNYAIHLAEKDSLTVKSFNELLKGMPDEHKAIYTKDRAEQHYRQYQENYLDDKEALNRLAEEIGQKHVVLLAPGKGLQEHKEAVLKACQSDQTAVIAVNFPAEEFEPEYIFSSNMRRFAKIQESTEKKCITTSNMKDCRKSDFMVNFSSYASKTPEIMDNSGLMLLKLLIAIGVKRVSIAGMDGYSAYSGNDYINQNLVFDFSKEAELRNRLISEEMRELKKQIEITFITPTRYDV